ncbi:HAD hydrolase-like protein [Corynebacterium diphtheriae]
MTVSYLSDMDGVLIKEGDMIPGADVFLKRLKDNDINFMVLTNNSIHTPRDLSARLRATGLDIPEDRIICTNPDVTGPAPKGILPATGAVAQLITAATGKNPYFVGKPNPVMMRTALNNIKAHSESTVMIGDRMDTDVRCGLEAGMRTILVRSGISDDAEVDKYPFRPTRIVNSIADLADCILDPFGDGHYADSEPR